ncbi:hypothetical protein RhiirA4_452223 [Rhizophagus irregularis]|uniref:Uncharacterized protein n=1 Tax=Rhizophagus irregularis TaxID=588596 RepID=A0A2I1FXG9_9GLOM|nr:hypothetical protein RhiirA4_452223 [Rhizophagus irregularis]
MQNIAKSDVLSDDFWNHVYKNIAKELILTILYSSDIEYQKALETYLSKHADYYIKNIRQNMWIFLFSDKLLIKLNAKAEEMILSQISGVPYFLFLKNSN